MKALSALEAEQSLISMLLMTLMAYQERKKNWQNKLSILTKPPKLTP